MPNTSKVLGVGIVGVTAILVFSAVSVLAGWLVWNDILGRPPGKMDGTTLVTTILPLPFLSFSCVLWLCGFRRYWFAETGGIPLCDDGAVAHLGSSVFDPLWAANITVGIVSFPMCFVAGFLEHRVPSPVAIVILLIVAGSGAIGAAFSVRRVHAGTGNVVVDRICEMLTLPANGDRTERLTVPWSSIAYVKVEQCNRSTDWSLGIHGMTVGPAPRHIFPYYTPVIVVSNKRGDVECEERVFSLMFESEANRLAEWLRRQIGRAAEGGSRLASV